MSSQKLFKGDPSTVMVIRKVTENITTLSVPFARFGLMKVGGRATIGKSGVFDEVSNPCSHASVRLRSGALAVFSPVALTTQVRETLSQMGEVKYITAPDMEHHIMLGPWHEAFPNAKTICPEGLPEKRAKSKEQHVRCDVVFQASKDRQLVDEEFDSEFDHEFVPGHANKELVFNFKKERTLIEADLLFNLPAHEQYSKSSEDCRSGMMTRFFGAMQGTTGSPLVWQRRLIWYGISAGDRPSYNKSMGRIDKWDFDRIIPCHGEVIETGGKQVFRDVMKWHLEALQKQSRR